jgi:MFS transporter, ceroid-lipofuscinosis neuronal protein 7
MDESKGLTAGDVELAKILETPDEKRTRMLSLKIIYFTMFLMTLGFSIILTGIWPYLDKVIRSARPAFVLTQIVSFRFS